MNKVYFILTFMFVCLLAIKAETVTVTTNADSGSGSFRQAVLEANDGDEINFDQAYIIYLTSPISLGDKNITIDGDVNSNMVTLDGNFLDSDGDWIDDDGVYTNLLYIVTESDFSININNLIIQNGSVASVVSSLTASGEEYKGGGVYIDLTLGGNLTFTNCTIQNNVLSHMIDNSDDSIYLALFGAGIYSTYGGDFNNCTIKNNVSITAVSILISDLRGSGIYIVEQGSFTNCLIAGNKILIEPTVDTHSYNVLGAGLYLEEYAEVISCVIIGNYVDNISDDILVDDAYWGIGGICCKNGKVYNSSIINNGVYNITGGELWDYIVFSGEIDVPRYSGGASFSSGDMADYQNNIFYGNYTSYSDYHDGYSNPAYTKYTAYSDETNYDAIDHQDDTSILLSESPFIELPYQGDDGEWGTDDDDYGDLRLKENSVCIDAGNPDATEFSTTTLDFYDRARITNDTIDLGAVESIATDFYSIGLSGSVWKGSSQCVSGNVYAYNVNDITTYAYVSELDEYGDFEFTNIESGEYYLYAIPENTLDYVATYYGDETAIENAISITVDNITYGVDIHLVETSVSTSVSTSVTEGNEISLSVYPNPTTDYINIQSDSAIDKIMVYNNAGNLVLIQNSSDNQLSVAHLPNGLYVISIHLQYEVLNYQILKK